MNDNNIVFLVIGAFLIAFPLLWIGIVLIISRISGWPTLAALYPGGKERNGEVCSYASLRLRLFVSYSRCLTITVSNQGIHIRPMIVFRPGHDPIMIPWSAVVKMEQKGLALFPFLDMYAASGNPNKPIKIGFYGRRLVETLVRYGNMA